MDIKTTRMNFVYPDLQWVLEKATSLQQAMFSYQKYTEEIVVNPENYFEAEADIIGNFKCLMTEFLALQERYIDSYQELLERERSGNSTGIVKFFKDLGSPIAAQNPKISFDFSSRFKSYFRFIQKCMTKLETMELLQVRTIQDLQAMKLTVHSAIPKSNVIDYESAQDECYELFNSTVKLIMELGGILLPVQIVGVADDRVNPLYRNMMKDYIKNPKFTVKEDGSKIIDYQALHSAFEIKIKGKTKKFELQVNSLLMQKMAKDHTAYKVGSKLDIPIDFSRIIYPDFLGESVDRCGLLTAKEITKLRTYQRTA